MRTRDDDVLCVGCFVFENECPLRKSCDNTTVPPTKDSMLRIGVISASSCGYDVLVSVLVCYYCNPVVTAICFLEVDGFFDF